MVTNATTSKNKTKLPCSKAQGGNGASRKRWRGLDPQVSEINHKQSDLPQTRGSPLWENVSTESQAPPNWLSPKVSQDKGREGANEMTTR